VRYSNSTPLFDAQDINRQITDALRREVPLPSGGSIVIDNTEALTAIDVNTKRYVGKKSLEETVLRTNIEAVSEIVRQLRLRDIGGIIVIDFIDMNEAKNRRAVLKALNQELERDRTKTYVVELTKLGLVEMTRKNVSEGLIEAFGENCPVCHGRGIIFREP
jgi:Rne/Rng family ribonuclease